MNFITNTKSLTILLFLACFYLIPIKTIDTITSSTPIKDPQTILSNGNISKLGFFTPENSTKRYLGIWLNQISAQTIIWIANRDKPLNNSSGLFTLSQDGNLVLTDGENETLWSSNLSNVVRNSSARLLDSGNLVLQDLSTGIPTWESFKHPCDKLLPKMKFTTNLITKEKIQLVSWRTSLNPSMGNFSLALDARLPAEAVILKNGELHYRTGPWNGQIFLGIPGMDSSYLYGFSLVSEDGISTFSYANISDPLEMTLFLTPQGNLEQKQWNKEGKDWIAEWTAVKNECDVYGACGKFGICNSIKLPICSCLKGYEPMNVEEWNRQNWTSGCVRKKLLKCERESSNMSGNGGKEDGFLTLKMVKVPYFAIYLSDPYTEEDCRYQCLLNCTCNAYSYESRFGCMLWNDNLIDMQQFLNGDTELYLRLAASELDTAKNITIIVSVSVMSGFLTLVICIYFLWKWRVKQRGNISIVIHVLGLKCPLC